MPDGRVLIADDEDSLRWVLEKGFRGAGYQVTAVKDGTTAFAQIETGPFDLILLDVRMPGMDGAAFARAYSRRRGPQAPIVVVSGFPGVRTEVDSAVAYFSKPFDIDRLLAVLRKLAPPPLSTTPKP